MADGATGRSYHTWHITEYTGMLQSTLTEYTVHYQHATTTGAAIYQARMSVPGSRGT